MWGSRANLNLLFCEKTYSLARHLEFRKKDLPTGVILWEEINNSETLRSSTPARSALRQRDGEKRCLIGRNEHAAVKKD